MNKRSRQAVVLAFALLTAEILWAASVITIDPQARRNPVNRKVLGMNQVSPSSRRDGPTNGKHKSLDLAFGIWNPETRSPNAGALKLSRRAGISSQRYPGGCRTHYFEWKKVIGDPAQRQAFGLDEFLHFCEESGGLPILILPDYRGDAKEMAELVEYLNSPDDGKHPWAAKRAANGHPEPYDVVYFEFGNETYHGNHRKGKEARNMTATQYAERFLETRAAMKAVDPRIKLGVVNGPLGWNTPIFEKTGGAIDFVAPHIYVGGYNLNDCALPPEEFFKIVLAGMNRVIPERLEKIQKDLRQAGASADVPLAVTEFNLHATQEKPSPYRFSLGGALVVAEEIRHFLADPNVIMANYWVFTNEYWGTVKGYGEPYLLRPSFYVFELYNRYLQAQMLELEVESPTFEAPGGFGLPRATRAAFDKSIKVTGENLLPGQKWSFREGNKAVREGVVPRELEDGTLEVVFKDSSVDNYFHANKRMPANPLFAYRLSAEVRTEGMADSLGTQLQIGDGRGYNATKSCKITNAPVSQEWDVASVVYTPLADTKSLVISARRLGSGGSGKMFIRNVRVEIATPDDIGPQPLLAVSASVSEDGKTVALTMVNKSMEASEPVTIRIPGLGSAQAEFLGAPRVWDTNEADGDTVILRELPVEIVAGELRTSLPKHSFAAVKIHLRH